MVIILTVACDTELLEWHGSENGRGETVKFMVGRGFGFQKGRIRNLKERKQYWTRKASPIAPIFSEQTPQGLT